MAKETDFGGGTIDELMSVTGAQRQVIERQIAALLLANDPAGIFLTIKNAATDARLSRRVSLSKTVAELLLFDSLNLFPEVDTPEYRVQDLVVTLDRTGHVLGHSRTLRDAGVQDYDTLKIALGPASNRST
jgi:hypothetical protein